MNNDAGTLGAIYRQRYAKRIHWLKLARKLNPEITLVPILCLSVIFASIFYASDFSRGLFELIAPYVSIVRDSNQRLYLVALALILLLSLLVVNTGSQAGGRLKTNLCLAIFWLVVIFSVATDRYLVAILLVYAAWLPWLPKIELQKKINFVPRGHAGWILMSTLLLIGTLIRLTGLENHPAGFPQHTLYHFEITHRTFISHIDQIVNGNNPFGHLSEIIDIVIVAQQGLISLLESLLYYFFQPTYLLTRLLPLCAWLVIPIAFYVAIRKAFGWVTAIIFTILNIASPWLIAFSRYSDLEHITCITHIALMSLALVNFSENRKYSEYLFGLIAGMGMYLYALNQVVSLVAFPVLLIYLAFKVSLNRIFKCLISYSLLLIPSTLNAWERGKLLPIRTPYEGGDRSYVLSLTDNIIQKSHDIATSLISHSPDPWYWSETAGALTPLEVLLLLPALSAACIGVYKCFGRVTTQSCVLLFFGLLIVLGLIPSYLSPYVFVRRLMLTLIGIAFFSAMVLGSMAGKLSRVSKLVFVGMLLVIQTATGSAIYFGRIGSLESELNIRYYDLSLALKHAVSSNKQTLACIPGTDVVDMANSIMSVNFLNFSQASNHFASAWNTDESSNLKMANSSNCLEAASAGRHNDAIVLIEFRNAFQPEYRLLFKELASRYGRSVVLEPSSGSIGQIHIWQH